MSYFDRAAEIIKEFEGLRLTAYQCPAGVWTIGYGSTGRHVHPGLIITEKQADDYLLEDMLVADRCIRNHVKVPLHESQIAALVSFIFNVGCGAFAKSTLLKHLNANRVIAAAAEFARWNKAGSVELPGLVRRRAAERKLFEQWIGA